MNWIVVGAINIALAIALGAFGAHGLKTIATIEQMAWWQTATQYFFFNSLGLLVIGMLIKQFTYTSTPAYILQLGTVLFVGSLYAMALGAPRWFGAITPIGGILMIVAWLWLARIVYKNT